MYVYTCVCVCVCVCVERQMVHLQQKNKIAQMTGKKEEQEAAGKSPAKLTGVMAVFSAVRIRNTAETYADVC
jgi:hypothetical protein